VAQPVAADRLPLDIKDFPLRAMRGTANGPGVAATAASSRLCLAPAMPELALRGCKWRFTVRYQGLPAAQQQDVTNVKYFHRLETQLFFASD
jgi:hypothetical protein